jgi:hypothetical protein
MAANSANAYGSAARPVRQDWTQYIVKVHFEDDEDETIPPPGTGTVRFVPSGQTFVLPADNGIRRQSAGYFNVVISGSPLIGVDPFIPNIHVPAGASFSFSSGLHVEVWGGTLDGSPLTSVDHISMSGSVGIMDTATNTVHHESGFTVAGWTTGDNFKDGPVSTSGIIPAVGHARLFNVFFSATIGDGLVVIGNVRVFPSFCTVG